jgi:hypothetical protein
VRQQSGAGTEQAPRSVIIRTWFLDRQLEVPAGAARVSARIARPAFAGKLGSAESWNIFVKRDVTPNFFTR